MTTRDLIEVLKDATPDEKREIAALVRSILGLPVPATPPPPAGPPGRPAGS